MIVTSILYCSFISLCCCTIITTLFSWISWWWSWYKGVEGDVQIIVFSTFRGLYALILMETFIDYTNYFEHGDSPGRYYNKETMYSVNVFSVSWERKACTKTTILYGDAAWLKNEHNVLGFFSFCTPLAMHFFYYYFLTLPNSPHYLQNLLPCLSDQLLSFL